MISINKIFLSFILLFSLGFIWGSSFIFIKFVVNTITPITAVLIRMAVASMCLYLYLILTQKKLPMYTIDIKNYTILAIFGNVLPFVLVSWAEIKASTNLTGIIMGLMPITTVLLAFFFVKEEKISKFTFIGIIFGFVGLLFLLEINVNQNTNLFPHLAIVFGAFSFAVATVYARKIKKYNPLFIVSGSTFFAFIILIPLVFYLENPFILNPSTESIFFSIVLGILNTAIGGFIFFKLIQLSGASFTSTVNFITPFVAVLLGYFILNETLNFNQLCGFIFILFGIYVVQKSTNA